MNTKSLWRIVGIGLLLGLGFNYAVYNHAPGLGFVSFVIAAAFGWWLILAGEQRKPSLPAIISIIGMLFFGGMVAVRSDGFLTFVNIILVIYCAILTTAFVRGQTLRDLSIGRYFEFLTWPIAYFVRSFRVTTQAITQSTVDQPTKQRSLPILRGILLALPLLFIFALLFGSADLIFDRYFDRIITISIDEETIFRTILVLLVAAFAAGAYSWMLDRVETTIRKQRPSTIGHIEQLVILSLVNLLFVSFIGIQIAYLFGSSTHLADLGVTYAEYARRGFFELIVAGGIAFLLILFAERGFVAENPKTRSLFTGLCIFLLLQVVFMLISAFIRLSLYEEAYGFTTTRFWAHGIIIWLAVIVGLLAWKVFRHLEDSRFAYHLFLSVVSFFVIVNIVNPSLFVAKKNIDRLADQNKIDIDYLGYYLSEDATPALVTLLNNKSELVRNTVASHLYDDYRDLTETGGQSWQGWHLARLRARNLLEPHRAQLEANKDYRSQYACLPQSLPGTQTGFIPLPSDQNSIMTCSGDTAPHFMKTITPTPL